MTWKQHLTAYRAAHPRLTLKEAMKGASKTYRRYRSSSSEGWECVKPTLTREQYSSPKEFRQAKSSACVRNEHGRHKSKQACVEECHAPVEDTSDASHRRLITSKPSREGPSKETKKLFKETVKVGIGTTKQAAQKLDDMVVSGMDLAQRKGLEAGHKWWDTYKKLMDVDSDLPAQDADCWKDPKERMEVLQNYLALKFNVPAHSSTPDTAFCEKKPPKLTKLTHGGNRRPDSKLADAKARAQPASGTKCPNGVESVQLAAYQSAMIAPLARVDELLVVSGTGTGKSQMYMQALAALPAVQDVLRTGKGKTSAVRCYVVCPDDDAAYLQFKEELCKAPGWASVRHRINEFVSLHPQPRTKLINFIKYTTAGRICVEGGATSDGKGKLKKCEFDNAVIVFDEVHLLVTLQGIWPNQVRSVLALAQWLRHRRYHKFLALTATPPVSDFGRLTTLLNYFMPEEKKFVVKEQVQAINKESSVKGLIVVETELNAYLSEHESTDDQKVCRVSNQRSLEGLLSKLEGLSICMYSSDGDGGHFPSFAFDKPRTIMFKAPGIMPRPKSASKKSYDQSLVYQFERFKKISKAWGSVLCNGVPDEYDGIDPNTKTLIFVSQHDSAVQTLYDELKKRMPKVTFYLGLKKSSNFAKALHTFNAHVRGGCMIANTSRATGLTYWGVRELHQLMPVSAELDVQMVGRVRRFCSHGALPANEWNVRHYVWEHVAGDVSTCERVLADWVASEKRVLDSLLATLWDVSFTKKCFYRIKPRVVQNTGSYEAKMKTWQEEWAEWARKHGEAAYVAAKEAFVPDVKGYIHSKAKEKFPLLTSLFEDDEEDLASHFKNLHV